MLKVKLRVKLLGAFGLVLLLLVAVMGVYQYLSSYTTTSFKNLMQEEVAIADHAAAINAYELQCRRNEKDFLLRKDKKYLQKLNENITKLKQEAQSIVTLAKKIDDQNSAANASSIIAYANEYQTAFEELVASWETKGLDHKSGLQGEFRAAAHKLSEDLKEHAVDSLQLALLTMRRYEKDFIRTGSDRYKQNFTAAIDTYKELLKTTGCEEKSRMTQEKALSLYEKAFNRYLAADQSSNQQEQAYARRNMTIIKEADKTISIQAAELQKRNDELSILHDLSQVTSQSLKIDALLHSVLEILSDRLSFLKIAKKGIIFLCKGDKLEIRTHTGVSREFIESHQDLKIGEWLCGKSVETGQILMTETCEKAPHLTEALPTIPEHGHIIIPLKVADRSLGVLCLYTKPQSQINDHHRRLLEDIGSQIGVAIEKAALFQKVEKLSLHDALTGLPNRRLMENFLQQTQSLSARYGRDFSLIMADIDHFKNYNDSYGHTAGDEVLQQVASLMQNTTRESDLVARYGGEEFLIVLPESDAEQAHQVAEQIRIIIEQKTEVTISCGYATYKPCMQLEDLIQAADQALYRAKDEGRNRVVGS